MAVSIIRKEVVLVQDAPVLPPLRKVERISGTRLELTFAEAVVLRAVVGSIGGVGYSDSIAAGAGAFRDALTSIWSALREFDCIHSPFEGDVSVHNRVDAALADALFTS